MWIALHNGTVHECTGISFVGVTKPTYLTSDCCLLANSHFIPLGNRHATSAKSRTFDNINNVRRLFVKQAIGQCKVSFTGDILFNISGSINHSYAMRCGVVSGRNPCAWSRLTVCSVLGSTYSNRSILRPPMICSLMIFFRIFGSDLGVKGIIGDDFHDRTFFTEAETAYGDDFYFVGDFVLFNGFRRLSVIPCWKMPYSLYHRRSESEDVAHRMPVRNTFQSPFITFFAQ